MEPYKVRKFTKLSFVSITSSPLMYPFMNICINAPEGCRHGTHTNGTANIRGTYSRVHTQTHTNTNKHPTWPDKVRCGLTPWRRPPHQRRAPRPHPQQAASLSRSSTPKLCAPPPTGAVPAARATSTSTSSLRSRRLPFPAKCVPLDTQRQRRAEALGQLWPLPVLGNLEDKREHSGHNRHTNTDERRRQESVCNPPAFC
jgi:hypothetical protein